METSRDDEACFATVGSGMQDGRQTVYNTAAYISAFQEGVAYPYPDPDPGLGIVECPKLMPPSDELISRLGTLSQYKK